MDKKEPKIEDQLDSLALRSLRGAAKKSSNPPRFRGFANNQAEKFKAKIVAKRSEKKVTR